MTKQSSLKLVKIVSILIVFNFEYTIANQFSGFKAHSHTKISSNFTRIARVAAITECSIRCRMKQNCFAANWKDQVCELLEGSVGSHLQFEDAHGWTYMCKYFNLSWYFTGVIVLPGLSQNVKKTEVWTFYKNA